MAEETSNELIESTEEVFQDEAYYSEPLYMDTTFWVAISFLAFIGVVLFYKLPQMIAKTLDKRAADISTQLDEARKLREEAQALLAQYQRKQRDAETEAQDIVAHAEAEAKRIAEDAEKALAASIARREQLARDKIAQAEAAAVKDVQTVAVNVATEAARKLIAEGLAPEKAGELVEESIRDLPKHLH
ncbi:MAG: F0F1 ATP synthase subunit B [Alphaproteobacteria bacterium]